VTVIISTLLRFMGTIPTTTIREITTPASSKPRTIVTLLQVGTTATRRWLEQHATAVILRLGQLPVRSVLRKLLRPVTETRQEKETTATTATNTAIRDKTVTATMTEIGTAPRVITGTATRAVIKDTTMTTVAIGNLSTVIKALFNRQLPVKATTAIVMTTDDIPLRPSRLSTLSKRLPRVAKVKAMEIPVTRRKITILPVRTTMLSSLVYFMVRRIG
jgi:hypothetical protein